MPRIVHEDQGTGHAGLAQRSIELYSLRDGHQVVELALQNQERRIIRADIGDRARPPQRILVPGKDETQPQAIPLARQLAEVGRPVQVGHRLHPAGLVPPTPRALEAGADIGGAEQRHQVPAGARPVGADAIRVDAELGRVGAQEPHRALDILDHRREVILRGQSVVDRHECVPPPQ